MTLIMLNLELQITLGATVVVQAPIKTFTANNSKGDGRNYTSYTRPSGTHVYGIDKIQDRYDSRFDDPTYYS